MQVTVDSHDIALLEGLNEQLRVRLALVRAALDEYNSGYDERMFCLSVDRAVNGSPQTGVRAPMPTGGGG